jgi:predicted dehydrogenase
MIGGTRGSLTVPSLDFWHHPKKPSWWEPIARDRLSVAAEDPLSLQIRNLCEVVRGRAEPVVTGREGLKTLKVIAAVKEAAASGQPVTLS